MCHQDIKSLNYVMYFINYFTVTIIVDTDYHCTSRNVVQCWHTISNIF